MDTNIQKAPKECKFLPTLDEEALRSLGIAVKNSVVSAEEFYKSIVEADDSLKELKEKFFMEEYKQRMVNEYRELKERHTRLCAILERRRTGVLDFTLTCPVGLLEEQEKAMRAYMDILKRRAVFEHIDLEKETLADGTIEH